MSAGLKRLGTIAALACAAAVGGIAYWKQMSKATLKEKEATIVSLDPANRTARIKVTHPKTGEPLELPGDVPPECEITIDGQRAQMSDLRVGETVLVKGLIYRSGHMTAQSVHVTRHVASEPTP